jgi:coenzyme F420-reducing hydrogenase alpha subunit
MSRPRKRDAAKAPGGAKRRRNIKVDNLARVEGEGALIVRFRGDELRDVELKIFEPPRFFEAFLRGRRFTEAPDITARICGICPVAYQMSSCHAMEAACGVEVTGPLRELRRLLYCGEWIESHALHVYMLHAPDFLDQESAIHLAREHPEIVNRGLQMKKVGNDLLDLLGGRAVHPVNVRVGGFYKLPSRQRMSELIDPLEWGREAALETVRWVAGFDFPDLEQEYEFVSLRHPAEYPFNEGRLVSNRGLDIEIAGYEDHFREHHVPRSNALHSSVEERGAYHVGPLARFNLNFDRLSPAAQEAAREAGLEPECRNPFRSIVVRAVELLYAYDEALRIVRDYEPPDRPFVEVEPRPGTGHGCTEAPRGMLWHRYEIDGDGSILAAKIVPPTSQNQAIIESDLRRFVEGHIDLPHDRLTWHCEQVIRNYDPCISCATHFLRLRIERE